MYIDFHPFEISQSGSHMMTANPVPAQVMAANHSFYCFNWLKQSPRHVLEILAACNLRS